MPYVIETYNTPESLVPAATAQSPFGPGFSLQDAQRATKLEVVGSSFTDPGNDWCEYRLYREDHLITARRVEGY